MSSPPSRSQMDAGVKHKDFAESVPCMNFSMTFMVYSAVLQWSHWPLTSTDGTDWLCADPSEGKLMTRLMPPVGARFPPQPLLSEFVITDGQWHRIGFVRDGSQRMLYVDDVKVATDTQASLVYSTGGLYIGAGSNLEPGSFFSGLIDDVRIYNRAVKP